MAEKVIGLDDNTIINAVLKNNPNLGGCVVTRGKAEKKPRYTSLQVTVTAPQKTIRLIEKIYSSEDKELFGYNLFNQYSLAVPQMYHINIPQRTILMEDLNNAYIQGFHFNENSDNGLFIRENYEALIRAAAKLHSIFWENGDVFGQTGLDWRHESGRNLIAHISGMEKDFRRYKKEEEASKIPKKWEVFENTIELEKLEYFPMATKLLKQKYGELLNSRFNTGKNITVIHGDMHPGNAFVSKYDDRSVKFIDMQAIRVGLCTEDLAMLISLHIEPDKEKAQPLLDYYYECLCKIIKDYPYQTFMNDYKISVMENMFFPIRLINRGIYDFSMRDKAIKAFETFVFCDV